MALPRPNFMPPTSSASASASRSLTTTSPPASQTAPSGSSTSTASSTSRPLLLDRLRIFSRTITGIILPSAAPLVVFSYLDGDIHISDINGGLQPTHRAQLGDIVKDRTLVDFTGCNRFWVGLYAVVHNL